CVPAVRLVRTRFDDASSAGRNAIAPMFLRSNTPPTVALTGPTLEPALETRGVQPPPSTLVSIAVIPACARRAPPSISHTARATAKKNKDAHLISYSSDQIDTASHTAH